MIVNVIISERGKSLILLAVYGQAAELQSSRGISFHCSMLNANSHLIGYTISSILVPDVLTASIVEARSIRLLIF